MRSAAACAWMLAAAVPALAQTYPSRPVRLVMPFPAGTSSNDVLGRALAQRLGEPLGQQVIFENRSGASGTIGSEMVAKSAPDGYTLLLAIMGPMVIAPAVYPKLGYSTLRDFAPVARVATVPYVIVAHPSLPVTNIGELVALAKRQPGAIRYASAGEGGTPHLCIELLRTMAGIDMQHIPYKGGAPATVDTIAGQTQVYCASVTGAAPFVRQGKLRALGGTTLRRSPVLPDVPTIAEQGYAGFDVAQWMGVAAPARTPAAIVQRLYQDIARVLATPEMRNFILQNGGEPALMGPEEFGEQIRNDLERWARLVKTAGVRLE